MKLSLLKASGVAVLVAGMFSGAAFAGIANSKHDLTVGDNVYTPGAGGTAELCVFCHTPHAADASLTSPPLWNRDLSALPAYTTYTTSTIDGANAALDGGSISVACLSCHDGTVAINTVINAPGSGLNAPWRNGAGVAWTSTFGGVQTVAGADFGKMIGATTSLGTDLKNDHPVSIQYGGGPNVALLDSTVGIGKYLISEMKDAGFKAANTATINSVTNWYIDNSLVGVAGTREKTDILLYSRNLNVGGYNGNQPFVECASCHDPHGTANNTFLRMDNAGSKLCLACHNK